MIYLSMWDIYTVIPRNQAQDSSMSETQELNLASAAD